MDEETPKLYLGLYLAAYGRWWEGSAKEPRERLDRPRKSERASTRHSELCRWGHPHCRSCGVATCVGVCPRLHHRVERERVPIRRKRRRA